MLAHLAAVIAVLCCAILQAAELPTGDPGAWNLTRRGEIRADGGALVLKGRMATWPGARYGDVDLRAQVRLSPEGEAWLRFRYTDDNTHYALALRANNCNDLLLFRFCPGGLDRVLAAEKLGFAPRADVNYRLRVQATGGLIRVWLDDEAAPRVSVVDGAPLGPGLVGFGGGPFEARYGPASADGQEKVSAAADEALAADAIRVNFQTVSYTLVDGYLPADGAAYTHERGWGWTEDMQGMMRERKLDPDKRRDTVAAVAHGRGSATFILECRNGDYVLTLEGGDPGFGSHQEVYVNGEAAPSMEAELPSGVFRRLVRPVTVTDHRLTVTIKSNHPGGQSGGGINWFALEPRTSVPDKYAVVSQQWALENAAIQQRRAVQDQAQRDRVTRRQQERVAWQAQKLPEAGDGRTVVDLSGDWLLLPDQERAEADRPQDPNASDATWHVAPVPAFLKPVSWWIYAPREGTSDTWVDQERRRCEAFSFDYARTNAAWYRQWLDVPASYAGKDVRLRFRAVAAACQVWLNGQPIGGHTGMFAPFELDATAAIRPGQRNCLTVLTSQATYRTSGDPNQVLGVAVTVELTRDMLEGLPHGMYGRNLGIWQPVELIATAPAHMAEVQVTPSLTGLKADVRLANAGAQALEGEVAAEIAGRDGSVLWSGRFPVKATAGAEGTVRVEAAGLAPKLWAPETPNLYDLNLTLKAADGTVLDRVTKAVGFRTFQVRGNRLYLNGKPYWLRGANHCPSGLRPNDAALARKFMGAMHEGNTMVTRTHGSVFSEVWLQAADEAGVGVSMEGIWPWVLSPDSAPPPAESIAAWRDEWCDIIRAYRNHPCILMWTLNNESYWYNDRDDARRARKWQIASDQIRAMRAADPSRPIVPDSGYVRAPDKYATEVAAHGLDDGDVDDIHQYYGWYSASPFALWGRKIEARFSGQRPAISQEFSQGYPNNDSGHPTRKYIDQHYVPEAWCGDWAYEDRDVSVFLARHAFLSKELAELARRERDKLCGLLHFANTNWWCNSFDADRMSPYPVYEAMKTALQPVLVSLELGPRHYFAGDAVTGRLCVVNDDWQRGDLAVGEVVGELLTADGRKLAECRTPVGATPYYGNAWADFRLALPQQLPAERADCRLRLRFMVEGREVSRNEMDLLVTAREWAGEPKGAVTVIHGAADLKPGALQAMLDEGKRVLLLNPGAALPKLLPEAVAGWRARTVEIVGMEAEEHSLFDGIQPLDLAWMHAAEGEIPHVADGAYVMQPGGPAKWLLSCTAPHGYLKKPTDQQNYFAVTAFELQRGKGRLVAMELTEPAQTTDPVGARLVANALRALAQ
jgi:beta-galactosidase